MKTFHLPCYLLRIVDIIGATEEGEEFQKEWSRKEGSLGKRQVSERGKSRKERNLGKGNLEKC